MEPGGTASRPTRDMPCPELGAEFSCAKKPCSLAPTRLPRHGDVRREDSSGRRHSCVTSLCDDSSGYRVSSQPGTYLSPSSTPGEPRLWKRGQSSLPAARHPRRPRRPPQTHTAMPKPLVGVEPAKLPSRSRGYSTYRPPRHRSASISIGPWLSAQGGTLPGSCFLLVLWRSWAGKPVTSW